MSIRKASLQAVMDAADRIDASGNKVTQRGIRNELGGGSWSDIKAGWNEWVSIHGKLSDEQYSGAAADEISCLKSEISELTAELEHEKKINEYKINHQEKLIAGQDSLIELLERELKIFREREKNIHSIERWQSKIVALDFEYHLKCVEIEALRKLEDSVDYGFSVEEKISAAENMKNRLFEKLKEARMSSPLDNLDDKKTNLEEK